MTLSPADARFTPAASIDEVIDRLATIVDESRERGERYGLFASLYPPRDRRTRPAPACERMAPTEDASMTESPPSAPRTTGENPCRPTLLLPP